jgi:SAM-dependent methyltransferase
MERAEFDKFADEYEALHRVNLAPSGEAPEYFADYKVRDLERLLRARHPVGAAFRLLDFGAGIGTSIPFLRKYLPVAKLTCVDVSVRSLGVGVSRFARDAEFVAFDGARLPFGDSSFDCIFAGCVFHHVSPSAHRPLFGEFQRVLRRSGLLMIYEHNPLNPLTVRTVKACPFDDNAILLRAGTLRAELQHAGFDKPETRYRVFFPRALRWLRPLEDALGWLPLGAQYYVAATR